MPFFERQGFQLHYEVFENLVPHDVVAIHGNLASNAWWRPLLRELAPGKSAGRFIAAEWRGCGKSKNLLRVEDLALPVLAEDFNALVRHLGAKPTSFLAHSTGCSIALQALALAPDLYRRALLLNPVGATGVQFGPEIYDAFTSMSRDRSVCAAVMASTIHGVKVEPELLEQIVSDAFAVHPLVWHGVPRMLQSLDLRTLLPQMKQPVLVLHGELDTVLPLADAEALARALPNGEFQMLAGRGHSTNVEDPALLAQHLNQFLNR